MLRLQLRYLCSLCRFCAHFGLCGYVSNSVLDLTLCMLKGEVISCLCVHLEFSFFASSK